MRTIERLDWAPTRGWLMRFAGGAAVFALVVLGTVAQISTPPPSAGRPQLSFWQHIHVDGTYEPYDSLTAIADDASVVVVGRFVAVSQGRVFDPEPQYGDRGAAFYLNAIFVVDDVLRGSLADPPSDTITVELFTGGLKEPPAAPIPTDRQILFLINKAKHPANLGLSKQQLAIEARCYEILGGQVEGRLTIEGGTVTVSDAISDGEFPSSLAGQSAGDVIAAIRSVD